MCIAQAQLSQLQHGCVDVTNSSQHMVGFLSSADSGICFLDYCLTSCQHWCPPVLKLVSWLTDVHLCSSIILDFAVSTCPLGRRLTDQ